MKECSKTQEQMFFVQRRDMKERLATRDQMRVFQGQVWCLPAREQKSRTQGRTSKKIGRRNKRLLALGI